MSEWKEYALGDIADIIPGFAFKSEEFGTKGDIVIKIKDIVSPNIDLDSTECVDISKYSRDKLSKYILYKGDYVVAMTGATIGKIGRLKEDRKVLINQRVAKIRAKAHVNDDFVYYSILSNEFQLFIQSNIDSHSAQENISGSSIARYPIKLPPLSEQKAIAEILSSLDDKIDLLHRQNKTLEKLAETLFRQWFVEEASSDWKNIKVSDVAQINERTISSEYSFDEIEYLDTGSITAGKIDSFQTMKLKEAPSRARRIIVENDIVYSLVRPIHRHYGLLQGIRENVVASTGFCVITCNRITPYFIYMLLIQSEVVEYLDMVAEGSTSAYPSLKPSDLADFTFSLPASDKLNEFHLLADEMWKKVRTNYKQIETLSNLRDSILPGLVNGSIRVESRLMT